MMLSLSSVRLQACLSYTLTEALSDILFPRESRTKFLWKLSLVNAVFFGLAGLTTLTSVSSIVCNTLLLVGSYFYRNKRTNPGAFNPDFLSLGRTQALARILPVLSTLSACLRKEHLLSKVTPKILIWSELFTTVSWILTLASTLKLVAAGKHMRVVLDSLTVIP